MASKPVTKNAIMYSTSELQTLLALINAQAPPWKRTNKSEVNRLFVKAESELKIRLDAKGENQSCE